MCTLQNSPFSASTFLLIWVIRLVQSEMLVFREPFLLKRVERAMLMCVRERERVSECIHVRKGVLSTLSTARWMMEHVMRVCTHYYVMVRGSLIICDCSDTTSE